MSELLWRARAVHRREFKCIVSARLCIDLLLTKEVLLLWARTCLHSCLATECFTDQWHPVGIKNGLCSWYKTTGLNSSSVGQLQIVRCLKAAQAPCCHYVGAEAKNTPMKHNAAMACPCLCSSTTKPLLTIVLSIVLSTPDTSPVFGSLLG
eukprot:1161857-Pelagomonas_calceolata.AAC.3